MEIVPLKARYYGKSRVGQLIKAHWILIIRNALLNLHTVNMKLPDCEGRKWCVAGKLLRSPMNEFTYESKESERMESYTVRGKSRTLLKGEYGGEIVVLNFFSLWAYIHRIPDIHDWYENDVGDSSRV